MIPTAMNQNEWPFGLTNGIPNPPEQSELVKTIIAMEKELRDLRSQVGQINATLEVNFGLNGRRQDGLMVNSKDKSPLMFMVAVLTEYGALLKVARATGGKS